MGEVSLVESNAHARALRRTLDRATVPIKTRSAKKPFPRSQERHPATATPSVERRDARAETTSHSRGGGEFQSPPAGHNRNDGGFAGEDRDAKPLRGDAVPIELHLSDDATSRTRRPVRASWLLLDSRP